MEHFPVSLEVSRGAYGLLAKKAPSTGVIFVHGFQGNPRATWIDFQGLVEEIGNQRALWSEADLFFYAYRSRVQIRPLAEDFVKFLTLATATLDARRNVFVAIAAKGLCRLDVA
jgi:hypothetical protein